MSNVIFLEFFNKKNFPPGKWMNEPDFCYWEHRQFPCLTVRDMSLGIWKGFVGISPNHIFYNKSIEDILKKEEMMEVFFSVYGGICFAGKLPSKYKEYNQSLWWIGLETSHGSDYMPLLKLDLQDPDMVKISNGQTYKDFLFIRKETNKLAKYISKVV
jgi:hypothetical protein